MRLRHTLTVFILSSAVLIQPLSADIIITKDDMILNGKILEDKKPQYLILANNHGTFTIRYNLIKEIHKTDSFEEDVYVFRTMGKQISEEEVKKNYLAGKEKLEKQQGKQLKEKPSPGENADSLIVMLNFFMAKNSGDLEPVLPYSLGSSLSFLIPINTIPATGKYFLYGLDSELSYYHSVKGGRSIKGFNAAAGPVWVIPVNISEYRFSFNISALAGAGWYSITNDEIEENESAIKWNISVHAGPVFRLDAIVFSTQIRLDYIHDGIAPMHGAGLTVGAGYAF